MCPIPNGLRDRAISLYSSLNVRQDALRRATRNVLTRVAGALILTVQFSEMYYTK
jgi:hypothetical protein